MKIFDLIRVAAKGIKGVWMALITLVTAAAAFCLCFAGAILVSVSQEQGMSYELYVSGNNELKEADIAVISLLPGVKAATLVYELPVTLNTGEYSAGLTLKGINSSYINEKLSQGGAFADSSVMPYIILNDAACRAFEKTGSIHSAGDTGHEASAPDINWLSTGFIIETGGENNKTGGKVCGILVKSKDGDEQPQGYISIAAAKQLLKAEGQHIGSGTAEVRVKNIAFAATVSKAIEELGYQVSNPNEDLQKKWDTEYGEMVYLIVGGTFLLFIMAILSAARRKIYLFQQEKAYAMLQWMGMRKKEIRSFFVIQSVILSLIGVVAGIIIALLLPSFLSQDLKGISVYMLPIPFIAADVSVIICVITGLLSLLNIRKDINLG